jgi:two-component system, NarL family, nitrate/nitrite response regulator NarL
MFLTDVEKTILRCLAQGMHSKEIARVIKRSKPTVEAHIRLLYAKMSARSRAQLVMRAVTLNVISTDLGML